MQDGPYREIPLRARDGSVRAYTRVSPEDFDALNGYRWKLTAKGYAKRNRYVVGGKYVTVSMARVVARLEDHDPRVADHRNRDKLDNRRSNLRVVTELQNRQNQPKRGGSSSHPGVFRHGERWIAKAGKRHLGSFDTEPEAAAVAALGRASLMPYAED